MLCPDCPVGQRARELVLADGVVGGLVLAALPLVLALAIVWIVAAAIDRGAVS